MRTIELDAVIVGGGPAGLSAALNLGRARKRTLLCDAGSPRNAKATEIHGFVTRDGIAPAEFRRLGRAELTPYRSVQVREVAVEAITRIGDRFEVIAGGERVEARSVLLAVGMIDEPPDLPGYRDFWGSSIFQCPFCHAFEVQDGAFGVLATHPMLLDFAFMLSGWSRDLIVFTGAELPVPDDLRARFVAADIELEERPIRALHGAGGKLEGVELEGGVRVARTVLFARPPQRQTALVASLGLGLDEMGFVKVDDFKRTSVEGIYAAGDLTTMRQAAVMAAADGATAAAMMTHALNLAALGGAHVPAKP